MRSEYNPKPGFPKYSRDEIVNFEDSDAVCEGKILVVNGRGIFGADDQPYYDIIVGNDNLVLYKNIPENAITKKTAKSVL